MSNKKQETTAAFCSADRPQRHALMKDVRHKRLPATCVHLCEMSRKDKRMRKESRLPGADSRKEDSL